MIEPVLALRDLSVRLPAADGASVSVLDGLDLSVLPGELTALVGESGSGKTMAALAAMRLLPAGGLASGAVRFQGMNLLDQPERTMRTLRGRIGMVFQNPLSALNPSRTIGAQVAEGHRRHAGASAAAARARAIDLLGEVGIPDAARRLDEYPHQFSGGQRQRVMIAAALACDPTLLIADEPTTGLDPLVARQILALLAGLRRSRGLGVLFITHDLSLIADQADRLTVLYAGRVVEQGAAERFFASPRHPYAQALLAAVPRLNQAALAGIPGLLPSPSALPRGCRFAPRCGRRQPDCDAAYPPLEGDDHTQAACLHPLPPTLTTSIVAAPARPTFSATAAPLLELDRLSVDYGSGSPALRDISLSLARGECLGIVGESGSGKSTLGRAILQMQPYAGTIRLDGQVLGDLPPPELVRARLRMQPVFQDPKESLNPALSVRATLAEPLRLLGVRDRTRLEREVAELLSRVGLDPGLAGRRPAQLSGGQAQRVAVARALAMRPDLLVLDEPTSALDVSTQATLLTLLRDLAHSERIATIIISHDIAAVAWLADRIAVLQQGEIVALAPTAELIARPGHPYAQALLETAPRVASVGVG